MATSFRIRAAAPVPVAVTVAVVLSLLLGLVLARPASALADPAADPVGGWPLRPAPAVVAGFDPPDTSFGVGHRGVDLAGAVGQIVRSALPGRVVYAGAVAGRGVVVVDHGRTRTTYEPVTASVPLGAPVARGDPIGTLELGGSHCFPRACLHWGWLAGPTYLDPLRLVGLGPVRLLPLPGVGPAGVAPVGIAPVAVTPTAIAPVAGVRWGLTPAGAPAGRPSGAGRW
jgi:murein DD-endopeptidase MepM/ murein hydrolase activator NlpD